jgi:hypothetical protein
LPRDSIPAIDNPQFASADEAEQFLDPDELVIGVVINGDARAYPIPILSVHEIVNDVVGGEAIAVTWCPLCYSALVYSRNVEGWNEPLTFGVSGKLLYETLVMYDRQTESSWSQLYGAAVDGALEGARLSFFPSVLSEWSAWLAGQPDSRVLSKPLTCAQFNCGTYGSNPRGSYDVDPYAGYYQSPDEGVINRQIPRDEDAAGGRPKDKILGIRVSNLSRAYPHTILRERTLVNDELGGLPILIWFDPETDTSVAYQRRLGDRILTFELDPHDPQLLTDTETGSRWQAFTGTAIEGDLQGKRLPPLVSTTAFEFGWYAYFPESETYGEGG